MKLLLDTHAFIWLDSSSHLLSETARTLIADTQNTLLVSLVSIWEMQIKAQIGKLTLRQPLIQIVRDQEQRNRISILPITTQHIYELDQLPFHHRDPFDRLLIAQARIEQIAILTNDTLVTAYDVRIEW